MPIFGGEAFHCEQSQFLCFVVTHNYLFVIVSYGINHFTHSIVTVVIIVRAASYNYCVDTTIEFY